MEKENAGYQHFHLFPQSFLHFQTQVLTFELYLICCLQILCIQKNPKLDRLMELIHILFQLYLGASTSLQAFHVFLHHYFTQATFPHKHRQNSPHQEKGNESFTNSFYQPMEKMARLKSHDNKNLCF